MSKCMVPRCVQQAGNVPVISVPLSMVNGMGQVERVAPLLLIGVDGVCEGHQHSMTIRQYLTLELFEWDEIKQRAKQRGFTCYWDEMGIYYVERDVIQYLGNRITLELVQKLCVGQVVRAKGRGK